MASCIEEREVTRSSIAPSRLPIARRPGHIRGHTVVGKAAGDAVRIVQITAQAILSEQLGDLDAVSKLRDRVMGRGARHDQPDGRQTISDCQVLLSTRSGRRPHGRRLG
jgi:hypothetical protein